MTIQDLTRHKDLKTTMTLHPQKQTGAHRSASLRAGLHACRQAGGGTYTTGSYQSRYSTHQACITMS